ncbi:MAG: hypothetical protein U0R19_09020 [Bryobacteraceae bacterium]
MSVFSFLFEGHLAAQARFDFLTSGMVAMHSSFDLLFTAAPSQDEPVIVEVATGFDVNRSLNDGDAVWFAGSELSEQALRTSAHRRVDEVVQNLEPFRTGKHQFGQCLPVNLIFIIQDCGAELLDDSGIGFAAGFEDEMTEKVGLKKEASEVFEGSANETLTRREASG